MDLILQRGLLHQQKAVEAVAGVFKDVALTQSGGAYSHANPVFNPLDARLAWNVAAIQGAYLWEDERGAFSKPEGFLNLDVKMETGTGISGMRAATGRRSSWACSIRRRRRRGGGTFRGRCAISSRGRTSPRTRSTCC